MGDLIEISGLWLNETQEHKKYMVGYMGKARILIFKNDHKEEQKHPDYIMYIASPKPESPDAESDIPF